MIDDPMPRRLRGGGVQPLSEMHLVSSMSTATTTKS